MNQMIPAPPSAPQLPVADATDPADLARQYAPVAIRTLADIAQRGESEASRVAAANALLERGYGKTPIGAIEVGDGPSRIRIELV